MALKRAVGFVVDVGNEGQSDVRVWTRRAYFDEVYLVTALVPSDTACFASSPGSRRRTAVWISRDEIVERLL